MSEPSRLSPEVVAPAGGLALPASGEREPLVLARGNSFCVVNRRGDIAPAGARDLGLFHEDTRHLSRYELVLSGAPAVVLSSVTIGASAAQIDLALSDRDLGSFADAQGSLHLRRKQILDGAMVEQLVLTNHLRRGVSLALELRVAADFADIFEVRGTPRAQRGVVLPPRCQADGLVLAYDGRDGARYRTVVRVLPEPARVTATGVAWTLHLSPGETTMLEVIVEPHRDCEAAPGERESSAIGNGSTTAIATAVATVIGARDVAPSFEQRRESVARAHADFLRGATRVSCSDAAFAAALGHDLEDLDALRLSVDDGGRQWRILGAGIPWFAAPFGRDSLITSLQLLPIAPSLAAETLRTLAHFQGRVVDPWREEEPGKIVHELRRGEMARAGEVPHSPYYGSIDATPLWLILFGETWRWLADAALIEELMPAAERALAWLAEARARGHGWLTYQRSHEQGLINQGWKDSRDGVSFPDGTIAAAPIALVEVQGYVVAALEAMALVFETRDRDRSHALRLEAETLRRRLDDAFYVRATDYFALALDGDGQKVATLTSNPGHLLFAGALMPARASRVVDVLLGDELYSGWGVRTLGRGQAVFNPLSYHNGSVWPHDNALCALGAARYGRSDGARRILEGLHHASLHFRRRRLPELFCGLGRGANDALVEYPVSCSPQAWASGSFFMLLHACLGLQPDATARRLRICEPRLPAFLEWLELDGLRVGDSRVTLRFSRHGARTHCDVLAVAGADLHVSIEVE